MCRRQDWQQVVKQKLQLIVVGKSSDIFITTCAHFHDGPGIYCVLMRNDHNWQLKQLCMFKDLSRSNQLEQQGHIEVYQEKIRADLAGLPGSVLSIVSPNYAIAVLHQDFIQLGSRISVILHNQHNMVALITPGVFRQYD